MSLSFRSLGLAGLIIVSLVGGMVQPAAAAQFQARTLSINSSIAGETTSYDVSFEYPQSSLVGSLRFQFCDNAIPELPCVSPDGIDVSAAVLAAQSGNDGYVISETTDNSLVLSRAPSNTSTAQPAAYRFENVINPSADVKTFYLRVADYANTTADGTPLNIGSFAASLSNAIELYAQVPPILTFCVAQAVTSDECDTNSINYVDVGELGPGQTRSTVSEMQAYTNAQYGYAISVSGTTMTSGSNIITPLGSPTASQPGGSQFGINLTANNNPVVGGAASGPGTNAIVNTDYNQSNRFTYRDGDSLVTSSGTTPRRKFNVSYIVNVPSGQPAGIYSTSLTYVCLAGF